MELPLLLSGSEILAIRPILGRGGRVSVESGEKIWVFVDVIRRGWKRRKRELVFPGHFCSLIGQRWESHVRLAGYSRDGWHRPAFSPAQPSSNGDPYGHVTTSIHMVIVKKLDTKLRRTLQTARLFRA